MSSCAGGGGVGGAVGPPASKKFKFDRPGANPLMDAYPVSDLRGVHITNAKNNNKKLEQADLKFKNGNKFNISENGNRKFNGNSNFNGNNGHINGTQPTDRIESLGNTDFPMKKKLKNGKFIKNPVARAQELLKVRQTLPIYTVKKNLLKFLRKHNTNILIGETGSGKTTQVPQFLYEEMMLGKGLAVITQPRRVAAITVATRVAEEVGTALGETVGYSVRFEDVTSEKTKLKFATDGMLLREAMLDSLLMKYSWVIMDEAHERTINTDILLGVVKKAQKVRQEKGKEPLHILVMSATLDANKLRTYFNKCPILVAHGREHKLDILFTEDKKDDDYIMTCLSTVMQIHEEAPLSESILVFLTGQEEIDNACNALQKIMERVDPGRYGALRALPLYSSLPQHLQMEVFQPGLTEERRVICATNVAETSLTIPGIKYVVDSGKAKIRTYNPQSCFDVLKVAQISQVQAWQRAGRAGREGPGTCYHAYSERVFEKMPLNPVPEIHRTNLATVVLQLLTVGVTDVLNFDFLDKPRQAFLENAVEQLLLLGAVERSVAGELRLTAEGRTMASFPIEPKYSKILINGPRFQCTQEVLTIIAMLSGEQVLILPTGSKRLVATARHKKLGSVEGDHMSLLNIYQAFKRSNMNKAWCRENFLNHRNLLYCASVRKQLAALCSKAGLELTSCMEDTDQVRRCLLTGLFAQVAELQPDRRYLTLGHRDQAQIHPSSALHGSRPMYLLYTELVKTGNTYMHNVSSVSPQWLYEVAPDYFRKHHIKADAALYAPKKQLAR